MSIAPRARPVLAISGSLRAASTNSALLEAIARLAPAGLCIAIDDAPRQLPHFNPDLEDRLPAPVAALRRSVAEAEALIFSVPEYAHGIPGSFKNMLDWLVGGPEFHDKPVALFMASARSEHMLPALKEVVRTMSGRLVGETETVVHLVGRVWSAADILADPAMTAAISRGVQGLSGWLDRMASPSDAAR